MCGSIKRVYASCWESLPAMPRLRVGVVTGSLVGAGLAVGTIYNIKEVRGLFLRDVGTIDPGAYAILVMIIIVGMSMRGTGKWNFVKWMFLVHSLIVGPYLLVGRISDYLGVGK